jgi:endonuclease YncB( thermonuclease family)
MVGGGIGGAALHYPTIASLAPGASPPQEYSARFGFCHTGGGTNCVVDGDTAWIAGERVRVADIDAPETHPSRCRAEAELGGKATARLQELLNEGPFELEAGFRDADQYGRKLRVLTRGGDSIGEILVSEGLARRWTGSRQPWC